MLVLLITGVTGAGKSSVARRLAERGHPAVSLDADPRLCAWTNGAGQRVEQPAEPDAGWLAAHRWTWDPNRLDEIIAEARARDTDPQWLCGYAANALHLADRFDATFLLDIDHRIMTQRLRDRPPGNDFGRVGATLRAATTYYTEFVGPWREHGAITIDASQPLDTVVDDVLLAAASLALHRPPPPA